MAASTLFVRNLPTSASNGRLEEIFSEIGPVKHCFVVKEKGTDKCRGFGYVTFAMEEDAHKALRDVKDYDGKKISVVVAKRKPNDKKKAVIKEPAPDDHKPKGLKKNQMKARLIIRNLSFKCSEEDLRQVYSKFGTVLDVNIPLKPDGKMRGFAFVQLKNVLQAGTALKATNLKEIKGRQVAVDWAVAKDKFVATQLPSSSGTAKKPEEEEEKKAEEDSEEEEEEVEVPKSKGAKPAKQEVGPNAKTAEPEVESRSGSEAESNEQDSGDHDDDDDDDEDDDEEEAPEEANSDHSDGRSEEDVGVDDDDDEDDDDDDDDNDDDDDDSDDDDDEERPPKKKPLPSDVNQGKTVFIRNLSFDTEEEGLEEVLLQFGELKYIRIVLHPDTEHSKGCAFAQFKTKEAADLCLAACQDESESGGVRVDGRKLNIVPAVSREDAVKLKDKKVKTQTGTRNLYLAREGLIRAGTKAAEGVPEADMAKRTRFEELKRVKLRDIQVFVSKTRLCVHNLPKSVDLKQLRALCLKAAGGGKAVRITECRVMYDRKPEAGKVVGRSLGYGFVQFQDHEHALSALRHLNNNPQIFGPEKRPIVEFSLEDGRKLKMKEMRSQQQHSKHVKKGVAPDMVPGGPRQRQQGGGAALGAESKGGVGGMSVPYSGFKTKPEVEEVELGNGKKRKKVLHLPSHRGPKNRKRDRGKAQPPPPKKTEGRPSRKERASALSLEKQSQPRKRAAKIPKKMVRNREDQRFDSLVEQYKKRIMGNPKAPTLKKSKWFSS